MESIAVVCVTYNSAEDIAGFIASLEAELADGAPVAEVVIVDNGSTDGTLATVAAAGSRCVQVIASPVNLGFSGGLNLGLASIAPDRHVLIANADIRFLPGSISTMLGALSPADVGIVVPRLESLEGEVHPSLRRFPTLLSLTLDSLLGGRLANRLGRGEDVHRSSTAAGPADWATGAAWLLDASCRRAVGPWDESFFLYSEEVDYALRAKQAGWLLHYAPLARVQHRGGAQRQSPTLYSLSVLNRLELLRRHRGRTATLTAWTVLLLGELLRLRRSTAHRAAAKSLLTPGRRTALIQALSGAQGRPSASWLVFAAQDWWYHNQAHSDFQFARKMPPGDRVLVINSLGMRMPSRKNTEAPVRRALRKLRSMARGMRRIPNARSTYFVLSPLSFPFVDPKLAELNSRLVAWQIRLACLLARVDPTYIVTTIPTAMPIIERLPARPLLYNRSDKHSEFPEGDTSWVHACEERLLSSADVVLYVSRALMETESSIVGQRAEYLGHGVDLDLFRATGALFDYGAAGARTPEHPVVGFFGSLDPWLVDFELFAAVCELLPDFTVVVAGDVQGARPDFLSATNVIYLPRQPYEAIPALGRTFDVAVMPWHESEWIRMSNPIKLKEYLSLGLPIVSTKIFELSRYDGLVATASGATDFAAKVRSSLAADTPALRRARREAVEGSDWRVVSERLAEIAATKGRANFRTRHLGQ